MLIRCTVSDNILSALAAGPYSLDQLRRALSQTSYVSLRFHLARLEERGLVLRTDIG